MRYLFINTKEVINLPSLFKMLRQKINNLNSDLQEVDLQPALHLAA